MNDALGNEIKVGNKYVYTLKTGGEFTVRTGIAKKINTKTITFEIQSGFSCGDSNYRNKEWGMPAKAQVKPYQLIPFVDTSKEQQMIESINTSKEAIYKASKIPAKYFNTEEDKSEPSSEKVEEYYKNHGY